MGQAFMTRRGGEGKKLPELDLPAIASHIVEGYEAINGEGEKMVGTLGSNITKPATAAQIASGYQAINGLGELLTGTLSAYKMATGTYSNITSTTEKTVTKGSKIIAVVVEAYKGSNLYTAGVATAGTWVKTVPESSSATPKNSRMTFSGNKITFDIRGTDLWTSFTYYAFYQE